MIMDSIESGFLDKLKKHPRLQQRFNEILNIAENTSGDLITADEAELRTIEEVRKLGKEVIEEWANRQHTTQIENFENNNSTRKHLKKNSTGKQPLGE